MILQFVEKQLPIGEESKKRLMEIRRGLFNSDSDRLAEKVYTGDISIGQWEENMKRLIREFHSSMAAIGKGGWGEMTWADWGRLGPIVKEQYRYLHGFAETLAEKRDTISLAAIKARAHLYGSAGGYSAAITEAGFVIQDLLPWIPRDGSTECLVNCCCRWELDIVGESGDFYTVRCVWRLAPAEHCPDCIDRNGHVEMIRVHKSVTVPKIIGDMCGR